MGKGLGLVITLPVNFENNIENPPCFSSKESSHLSEDELFKKTSIPLKLAFISLAALRDNV